jgi:hypothetical protein
VKKTGKRTSQTSFGRNEGNKKDTKGIFIHETHNLLLGDGDLGRNEFVAAGGIRFRQLEPKGGSATPRLDSHAFEQRGFDAICMGYNKLH